MPLSPLQIAIVDDEEPVRKALRRLFRSASMDVETFASGRDFLDSLAKHRPDCVVLDLHMPGLTGRDVQQQLAQTQPALPVIIITGKDEPGVRESVLAAGAADYLLKPLNDHTLLAAVTSAAREKGECGRISQESKPGTQPNP